MENKLINDLLNKYNLTYEEDIRYKIDSVKTVKMILEIEDILQVQIKDIDFSKNSSVKSIISEYTNS